MKKAAIWCPDCLGTCGDPTQGGRYCPTCLGSGIVYLPVEEEPVKIERPPELVETGLMIRRFK